MRRLGAVLAGGESRRFGSDKALAVLDGRTLIERAIASATPFCERVVVIGRVTDLADGIPDWPRPGLGPLGGLSAALNHAESSGFDEILSVPVDCGDLPANLIERLSPAPAYLASQPVIGLWPVTAAPVLRAILDGDGNRAVRHFGDASGARAVEGHSPANINTPDDLAREAGKAPKS